MPDPSGLCSSDKISGVSVYGGRRRRRSGKSRKSRKTMKSRKSMRRRRRGGTVVRPGHQTGAGSRKRRRRRGGGADPSESGASAELMAMLGKGSDGPG